MQKLISVLFFVCCTPVTAQYFSEDQSIEDLTELKKTFLQYQPGIVSGNPSFDSLSSSIIDQVKSPQTHLQYFQKVSEICALANEAHTKVGTWNDFIHAPVLNNEVRFMPLRIRILDGKMYVWDILCGAQFIEKGDQVISINNISVTKILEQLRRYICYDGNIDTYFYKNVESGFNWMYYFYVDQPENFELELRGFETDARKRAMLPAMKLGEQQEYQRKSKLSRPAKNDPSDFYTIDFRDELAILTLRSFEKKLAEEYKIKSKKLYKSLFKVFRKKEVKELVIDLRGNTGGKNEFADNMVGYLLKEKQRGILKRIISWKKDTISYKIPNRKIRAFNGNIYALVDGMTYASGATLAKYVKNYGKGMIIGEETGTRFSGFANGSYEYLFLPNSNLRIGVAKYRIEFPDLPLPTTKNRGQIPDHVIIPTIKEEIADRDVIMEYLMTEILKR